MTDPAITAGTAGIDHITAVNLLAAANASNVSNAVQNEAVMTGLTPPEVALIAYQRDALRPRMDELQRLLRSRHEKNETVIRAVGLVHMLSDFALFIHRHNGGDGSAELVEASDALLRQVTAKVPPEAPESHFFPRWYAQCVRTADAILGMVLHDSAHHDLIANVDPGPGASEGPTTGEEVRRIQLLARHHELCALALDTVFEFEGAARIADHVEAAFGWSPLPGSAQATHQAAPSVHIGTSPLVRINNVARLGQRLSKVVLIKTYAMLKLQQAGGMAAIRELAALSQDLHNRLLGTIVTNFMLDGQEAATLRAALDLSYGDPAQTAALARVRVIFEQRVQSRVEGNLPFHSCIVVFQAAQLLKKWTSMSARTTGAEAFDAVASTASAAVDLVRLLGNDRLVDVMQTRRSLVAMRNFAQRLDAAPAPGVLSLAARITLAKSVVSLVVGASDIERAYSQQGMSLDAVAAGASMTATLLEIAVILGGGPVTVAIGAVATATAFVLAGLQFLRDLLMEPVHVAYLDTMTAFENLRLEPPEHLLQGSPIIPVLGVGGAFNHLRERLGMMMWRPMVVMPLRPLAVPDRLPYVNRMIDELVHIGYAETQALDMLSFRMF